MGDLFYWLLNMSIVATITGIVITIIRQIKALPRKMIVVLWLIPFLRFWVPFGVGGKYGLMSILSRFATKTVIIYEGEVADYSMMNSVKAANSYFPITYKVDILADVFKYAAYIWIIVSIALIMAMIIIYVTTSSEIKKAEYLYDNVYCSQQVSTPAVYGIIKPKIVIPTSLMHSENIDFIIMHEQSHIRRFDNLWRVVAFTTAALHWFNPFAWLFLKLFLSDSELACDESVLSKLPKEKIQYYANALLDVQESKTVFASSFGGAKLKTRIENIISFKKMTVFSVVGLVIFAIIIAYTLLTNAA